MVSELEALMPTPTTIKPIADASKVLRVGPLPIKKLAEVMKYIEESQDVLTKATDKDGFKLSVLFSMGGGVVSRANGLLRLLLPNHADILTDEWCAENLSTAHYQAIVIASMKQNGLYEVFIKAKDFLGGFINQKAAEALRQTQESR